MSGELHGWVTDEHAFILGRGGLGGEGLGKGREKRALPL